MARVQELGREAQDELRSLILELRPPDLERDGLCRVLRKHVELVGRLHATSVTLDLEECVTTGDGRRDLEILRIAQEALHNALRHAAPTRIEVRLAGAGDQLVLEVSDDGAGFDPEDPELRSRHLGLTSMQERARRLDGKLEIRSAAGAGTTVALAVGR